MTLDTIVRPLNLIEFAYFQQNYPVDLKMKPGFPATLLTLYHLHEDRNDILLKIQKAIRSDRFTQGAIHMNPACRRSASQATLHRPRLCRNAMQHARSVKQVPRPLPPQRPIQNFPAMAERPNSRTSQRCLVSFNMSQVLPLSTQVDRVCINCAQTKELRTMTPATEKSKRKQDLSLLSFPDSLSFHLHV